MDPETLNFWTNVAAIYVMCTAMVIVIITAVALGFVWWYVRKGRMALGVPFLYAQVYALRAQHVTMQVSEGIAAVPIGIQTTLTRAKTTTDVLIHGRKGRAN